jgi:hypothetical protein
MAKNIAASDGSLFQVSDHRYLDVVYAGPWHNDQGRYIHRYIKINGKRTNQRLHQFIGELIGIEGEVDHRDGNGFDNTDGNLRSATRSQNNMNRGVQTNNKLQVKGIHQLPTGKFRVQIKVNGIWKYRKVHDTIEEAKEAYRIQMIQWHGDFGREQ